MKQLLLLTVMLVCASAAAFAQAYAVEAGASSLLRAQGLTVAQYRDNTSTLASVGFAQGLRFGVARETTLNGRTFRVGDALVSLPLPTDAGDASPSFSTRGVMMRESTPAQHITLFAGASGDAYLTRFLSATNPQLPLAYLDMGRTYSPHFETSALVVAGRNFSSLASARFAPDAATVAAITSGLIAGKPVLRAAFLTRHATWALRIQQTEGKWHLGTTYAPDGTVALEHTGLNIHAEKSFGKWLVLDAGREKFSPLPGVTSGNAVARNAGAAIRFGAWTASARSFRSSDALSWTRGEAATAGWHAGIWQARMICTSSHSSISGRSSNVDTHVEVRLLRALRVAEDVSLGTGGTNFAASGGVETRWGSFRLTQNTYYIPFGGASGFHRAAGVSFSLHPFGNWHTEGDFERGAGISGYGMTGGTVVEGASGGTGSQQADAAAHFRPQPYVVRGTVVDQEQKPVRGAAIRVGDQTIFTTSDGAFEFRSPKPKPATLALAPGEFLTANGYLAETAPVTVTPSRDGTTVSLRVRGLSPGDARLRENVAEAAPHAEQDDAAASRLGRAVAAWRPVLRAASQI